MSDGLSSQSLGQSLHRLFALKFYPSDISKKVIDEYYDDLNIENRAKWQQLASEYNKHLKAAEADEC
jgi:hypothetical protein